MRLHHKTFLCQPIPEAHMDARKNAPAPTPLYEDFEPQTSWAFEETAATFIIYVPEFKKQNLKVQLTVSKTLKISGHQKIGPNKWKRFHKEIQIPENCDTSRLSATFRDGILYIRQPKLNAQEMQVKPTSVETPGSQQATTEPQPHPAPSLPPLDQNVDASAGANKQPEEVKETKAECDDAPSQTAEEKVQTEDQSIKKSEEQENFTKKVVDTVQMEAVISQKESMSEREKLNGRFFTELKKPQNLKKVATIVVLGTLTGLLIASMLKWYKYENQEYVPNE